LRAGNRRQAPQADTFDRRGASYVMLRSSDSAAGALHVRYRIAERGGDWNRCCSRESRAMNTTRKMLSGKMNGTHSHLIAMNVDTPDLPLTRHD